jgi:hypothetical protein
MKRALLLALAGVVAGCATKSGGAPTAASATAATSASEAEESPEMWVKPDDDELTPSVVAREVRPRLGALKACYERAVALKPSLAGRLVVHWTIAANGHVVGVGVSEETLHDADVARCIQSEVERWTFTPPSGGTVDVTFPFVFAPR